MYEHNSLKLISIPPEYLTDDIVDEIWDSHIYDKLIPLKQGMTVLDIGASIGIFSIYASQQIGKYGRVIAFEPETTSYNALIENLNVNNADNVTPLKMGVWSTCTTKNIQKARGNLGASTMFAGEGTPVQVCNLDTVLPQLGITHVDFVKIDTEGAATQILKGAANSLRNIDNFAIASYHIPHENPVDISNTLQNAGFRTKTLTRYGITPYVYATRDPTINLGYTELWSIIAVAGIAGLVAYQVTRK